MRSDFSLIKNYPVIVHIKPFFKNNFVRIIFKVFFGLILTVCTVINTWLQLQLQEKAPPPHPRVPVLRFQSAYENQE